MQPITATLDAAKTSVTLSSSIYIPIERISGWLNLPDGTVKSLGTGITTTDKDGLAIWSYALAGLSPGKYSIVLYGERSEVQGVGSFTIS